MAVIIPVNNILSIIQLITGYSRPGVIYADKKAIEQALNGAEQAFSEWRLEPVATRADYLQKAADLLEKHRLELVSLCIRKVAAPLKMPWRKSGKPWIIAAIMSNPRSNYSVFPVKLPGSTGEENLLYHMGGASFVCISP